MNKYMVKTVFYKAEDQAVIRETNVLVEGIGVLAVTNALSSLEGFFPDPKEGIWIIYSLSIELA